MDKKKAGENAPEAAQSSGKKSFFQFIKFAIVGVLNTLVDFLVYSVLVLIFGIGNGDTLMIGLFTFIGYACGVLNSFILNSRWTFKEEYKKSAREKVLFVVVNLLTWLVSFGLTYVFTNYVFAGSGIAMSLARLLHYTDSEQISKLVGILAKLLATPIVIVINFIGNKVFVFTGKEK